MEKIVDSAMTLAEATNGVNIPSEIKEKLVIIDVDYISFDRNIHQGQLVVHRDISDELRGVFQKFFDWKFPIEKVIPVVKYDWDDDASMTDNNSSAFNYRKIFGTDEVSNHSYGLAIDINPVQNPYVQIDGVSMPLQAKYNPDALGTLTKDGPVVKLFTSLGWDWGGLWERKDWQHFQKFLDE